MKRIILVLAVLILTGATAFADVTMTTTMTVLTGPMTVDGTIVTSVKGTKVRMETRMMNQETTILADVATKQVFLLNPTTKTLEPYNPQQNLSALPVDFGEVKVSITPSGQTKDVLGRTCQGFTMDLSIPMTINGETLLLKMFGPMWVTKDGPGIPELQAFQKDSAALNLSLSPVGQGPQAKAMAEATKAVTAAGIGLEQQMTMSMEGSGQMAQALSQMGGMSMTVKVTNISVDTIPDEKFAPLADVKK
jgi:hypothetical protein